MKNLFKQLVGCLAILLVVSCDPTKKVAKDPMLDIDTFGTPTAVMVADTTEARREKFNYLCEVEEIPSELSLWATIVMRNEIDGSKLKKWFYVREDGSTYHVNLNILGANDTIFILETRKVYEAN